VRVDAQETLTEGDKNGNMKERVWGQLVLLDPIDEKEAAEKFMNGNREAKDKEVNEGYPEADRRMRRALISRHLQSVFLEQAHFLQHLFVLREQLRPFPSGDLGLLHALFGFWSVVLAFLRALTHGGSAAEETERKEKVCARSARGRR
jgi:hypothetical protein